MDKHNQAWHRKNARRKVSSAKRQSSRKGSHGMVRTIGGKGISMQEAEAQYQASYMRKNGLLDTELSLWRKLWLRFISNYVIVKLRKVAHYFSTKKWQQN